MGLPVRRRRGQLRSTRWPSAGRTAGSTRWAAARPRPLKDYIEALRDAIDPALPLGLGEVPYGPLQVMHLQADTSALQEDTGWRPATPFEEGIRETIEWVRKETK